MWHTFEQCAHRKGNFHIFHILNISFFFIIFDWMNYSIFEVFFELIVVLPKIIKIIVEREQGR